MNQSNLNIQELIPSSEAARISGYSMEYIARLCRRGDVEAKRVGRYWYVVGASLSAHLAQRSGESSEGAHVEKDFLSADIAGKLVGYSGDYVSKLCREGSITCNRLGRVWHAQVESLERFATVQSAKTDEKKNTLIEVRQREYQGIERNKRLFNIVTGKSLIAFIFTQGVTGTSLIVLFAFATFFVSERLQHHPLVLSLGNQISDIGIIAYSNALIGGKQLSSVVGSLNASSQVVSNGKELGMVVLPSADERKLEEIKNSFSDEVIISKNDESTGIIKPVFKNSEGSEYVYLMVPVDERDEYNKEAP